VTVTVVGGGIAGSMAALSAAREGARVRLVADGDSSLAAASGLIDVLGYMPDGEGPLADPFEAIPDLPDGHPYRTVGVEAVREGLALFDEVAGDRYVGDGTERNALVPTQLGNLKPTARYPATVAPGVASREETVLLVGFEQLTAFDAVLAGDRLDEAVPYLVWGQSLSFPGEVGPDPAATDLAAMLEADERVATDDGEEYVRDELARELAIRVNQEPRVGLPAVLGYDDAAGIREGLGVAVGADVFEVPMGPPSVLGRRLDRLLREALADAGVERVDARVTAPRTEDGTITGLALAGDGPGDGADAGGDTLDTEAVVLATGGLVGRGLESDRRAVREPAFGCHVPHPEDRYDWFDDDALGDHPFAAFGVDTDAGLRPLDARGEPEYRNLRAAGATLGGYDFAAEKSGAGVSIATGHAAGRLAAGDAG
jgi:glycerol-3-phosphate dehydrogenase subunit B